MRHALSVLVLLVLLGGLGWALLPRVPLLDGVAFSRVLRDREGRLLQVELTPDDKRRIFTRLADISPRMIVATLRHEDRWFGRHVGVNPVSTLRAARYYLLGNARGGASTITMQVARLRFRLQTRTPTGKVRQIFYALALERHYSKSEILEAYFNLAPYGGNLEGVGAATASYLGKDPSAVSWPEAVALSLIPQSPQRRRPRVGQENPDLTAAYLRHYDRLKDAGILDDDLGRSFVLTARSHPGFKAPHYVNGLPAGLAREVTLTVDLAVQEKLEQRLHSFLQTRADQGVTNGAALLVDVRSMDVLAAVGSADFRNVEIHGQVDGTRSPRSPGSVLKPLLYALAMDQGLIHSQSLLVDAPKRFGGYNPENFDRDFAGPIFAREALARSRNVPAVELAARVSRPSFYEFLQKAEVNLPRAEEEYGLSIALGGEEVTMEDVVRLYAAMAHGGELRPLRKVVGQSIESTRLLSPEASFLTLQMLEGIPVPGRTNDASFGVAWKTGTSHGFRDAWAVAVVDHFVLAVWVGNFNGRANPAFVGRTCAGPLLFQMIDALRDGGRICPHPLQADPEWNLRQVEFCSVSGQIPTDDCVGRVKGRLIPGVSPITRCDIHRAVLVDQETGLRVSHPDESRPVRREVYEFWPTPLLALFEQAGLPRRSAPPFFPGSGLAALGRQGRAPAIVSPSSAREYSARVGQMVTLPLVAETESDVAAVYWFAGTKFLGRTPPREALVWNPGPGEWKVVALDDQGRSAARAIRVTVEP